MHKKFYLGVALIVLILVVGAGAYTLHRSDTSKDKAVTSPVQIGHNSHKNSGPATGQTVTVTGTIECLTPKNTASPQVSSCAIGLKQDNGKHYALRSPDPTTVGTLPTGQKVQVSGTLTEQSSQFDILGVIDVTSVRRL